MLEGATSDTSHPRSISSEKTHRMRAFITPSAEPVLQNVIGVARTAQWCFIFTNMNAALCTGVILKMGFSAWADSERAGLG